MNSSELFYNKLPSFSRFQECTDINNYYNFSDDWYIVLTDVVNSTKIIESGRYKDVNVISVLAMTSLMNFTPKPIEIPYLFGGDGVTFFVPKSLLPVVETIIEINQQIAIDEFDLKLRGTFVSIKEIYDQNYELKIAKQKVSDRYHQACIIGNGIDFAEQFLKSENAKTVPDSCRDSIDANVFQGFHCPFENVSPNKDKIVSMIIKPKAETISAQLEIYKQTFSALQKYLTDIDHHYPLEAKALKISEKQKTLDIIHKVETWHRADWFKKFFKFMLPIKHKIMKNVLSIYKKPLLESLISSDYKKLDGALKMTLACNHDEFTEINNILHKLYDENLIYYGLHTNDQALLTCSVLSTHEVHLIDGSDGGYAFASRGLKKQLGK